MNFHSQRIFYAIGFRENVTSLSTIIGRALTLGMLLVVWNAITGLIPVETLDGFGVTHLQLQYYFAITELIAFTLSYSFADLQTDIQQGYFSAAMLRPKSYRLQKLSYWMGQGCGIAIVLTPIVLVTTFVLTEAWYPSAETLLRISLHVFLSMLILANIHYIAGSASFWIGRSEPAYWILQKLNFVLGGLMIPITLYPDWLQSICWFTPFPAILHIPASLMLPEGHRMSFEGALATQIFWVVVLFTAAAIIDKSAQNRISKTGEGV